MGFPAEQGAAIVAALAIILAIIIACCITFLEDFFEPHSLPSIDIEESAENPPQRQRRSATYQIPPHSEASPITNRAIPTHDYGGIPHASSDMSPVHVMQPLGDVGSYAIRTLRPSTARPASNAAVPIHQLADPTAWSAELMMDIVNDGMESASEVATPGSPLNEAEDEITQ